MKRHLIEELVFDIAVDSHGTPLQEDAYLSRLVRSVLLPVVEEAFDGFDSGDAVLVLPSLEIDLGAIAQGEYEDTAAVRLRAALDDALHRALAQARQTDRTPVATGDAAAEPGASLVSRQESELAQLARFLGTGTMPWHVGTTQARLHEALLERLLERGGPQLQAMLARALREPGSARRLAAQFPVHQLSAVLRVLAGPGAPAFEALLAELNEAPLAVQPPGAAWVRVLAACADAGQGDADATCARIRAELAPLPAQGQAGAGIGALARFLDTGVLEGARDEPGLPAHQALLDRLFVDSLADSFAAGGEALRAMLVRVLANPHSARRLVAQFPERQLLALMRSVAVATVPNAPDAPDIEALLEQARQPAGSRMPGLPEQAWLEVLAACIGGSAAAHPLSGLDGLTPLLDRGVLPQADGSADRLASSPGAAGAPQQPSLQGSSKPPADLDLLAHYLESGMLALAVDDRALPAHQAVLDRLLASGSATLRALLARALKVPRSAQRLVTQFSEEQLVGLLRAVAGADAPHAEARLAQARLAAGGERPEARQKTWLELLGACLDRDRIDAAPAPDAIRAGAVAMPDLEALAAFFDAGVMPFDPDDFDQGGPEAVLGRLLTEGGATLRSLLVRVLANAPAARRFVLSFPEPQLRAAVRCMAGAHATPFDSLLDEAGNGLPGEGMALALRVQVLLACGGLADAAAAQAAVARIRAAHAGGSIQARPRSDFVRPAAPANASRAAPLEAQAHAQALQAPHQDAETPTPTPTPTPSYRSRLGQLRKFLESGQLPHAARGGDAPRPHAALLDSLPAHLPAHLPESLLDSLLAHPDDHLWRTIAQALQHAPSAARLLTQFPQRQLLALGAGSAPGYAPLLERLLQRLAAMPGAVADTASAVALLSRRHVLAACVARPQGRAWPGKVYAGIALELSGADAPARTTRYARSPALRAAGTNPPWRALAAERQASSALLRLTAMLEPLCALVAAGPAIEAAPAALAALAVVPGLAWREREDLAQRLQATCAVLEASLASGGARLKPLDAGKTQSPTALLGAIAAQLAANPAIPDRRREAMLDAIGSRLDEAGNPLHFLGGVLAALAAGAPLDLDALLVRGPVPETPAQLLATALEAGDAAAVAIHWHTLLREHGPRIAAGLRHYARKPAVRRALAQSLPDAFLIDLASLLDSGTAAILREVVTPSTALQDAVGRGAAWEEWTARCRLHALATLAGGAQAGVPANAPGAFLRALAPSEAGQDAALPAALSAQLSAQLSAELSAHLPAELAVELLAALPARFSGAQPQELAPPARPVTLAPAGKSAPQAAIDAVDTRELVLVGNAGMVLAAPYLPRLFSALGLLADGKFADERAAERAVHLLQYMVTGEAASPEYLLVLNKILCGLPTATPVCAGIDITQAERDCIEGLIQAMVAHAKAFGSCSVAAMRQTFLARQADLQLAEDAWQLRVHPGSFDMLLDRLPWGYSVVKFNWMTRPVHVTWRPAS